MTLWWEDEPGSHSWVEIRKRAGIGQEVYCPRLNSAGKADSRYELVRQVRQGDVIFHYDAAQSAFVGTSIAAEHARLEAESYRVSLRDFVPLATPVTLKHVRSRASAVFALRDELLAKYEKPLHLPFQFTQDPTQLRAMSNYFARMPSALAAILLERGPSADTSTPSPGATTLPTSLAGAPESVDVPIEALATPGYPVTSVGGVRIAQRREADLVHRYSQWSTEQGRTVTRKVIVLADGTPLATDAYESPGATLIEAKASSDRFAVRLGLGQILDYAQHIGHSTLALLLPELPKEDLITLLHAHGVSVIASSDGTFVRLDPE